MTKIVLFSAPYMQAVIDRFRPLLEDCGLALIVPDVQERLSEDEILVSLMALCAVMIAIPPGCWRPARRA
jgi:hypothetical protein